MAKSRIYMLCKVDVLLPDTPKAKSHVETYTYVVQEEYYGHFVGFIDKSYDFYGIVVCGQLISHSPKYINKEFTKL